MNERYGRSGAWAPGWLVGPLVATIVLFFCGFPLGFFASGGGFLIAGMAAFWAGWATASVADSARQGRNAVIVAACIIAQLCAYIGIVTRADS